MLVSVPSNLNSPNTQSRSEEASKAASMGMASLEISPNPLDESAVIRYELAVPGTVSLQLFDLSGRLMRTLVDREAQQDGMHQIVVHSEGLSAGSYVCKLTIGNAQLSKLVVVKK